MIFFLGLRFNSANRAAVLLHILRGWLQYQNPWRRDLDRRPRGCNGNAGRYSSLRISGFLF